jgi:hypothetical protein
MTETDWKQKKENWINNLDQLIDQIKTWSDEKGWLSEKNKKTIREEYIGQYTASSLIVKTPQGAITIDPVGRNIIGAEGRVDLVSFPSFNRMLLVRIDNNWIIKTDSKISWPSSWGRDTFYQIVESLTED